MTEAILPNQNGGTQPTAAKAPTGAAASGPTEAPSRTPMDAWALFEVFVRPRRGLSHNHVGSVHASDPTMALQNARDLYTRRQEGVSIWVIPSTEITASSPDREGLLLRARCGQDLPSPDLLRRARRGADVSASTHISELTAADRFEYVIRLADDSLIYSHRLAEWTSWAPQLEEDMALTNIALDLLGQARSLLTYAGDIEGEGNDEDDLAYLREEQEFRSCLLVEQPMKDEFGAEMARLLFYSAYSVPLDGGARESRDQRLAEIASKSHQGGQLSPRARH